MKKETFLQAIEAIRKNKAKEEKIADFVEQFTDSHRLVFKSSELENFVFNLLIDEYGYEDLLVDFVFFPEESITIGMNDNEFVIKNDIDLYYYLEYCTDVDNLYTLCEYMKELGLYEDMTPDFINFYDYVFNNIEAIINEMDGNVKTLAIDFKRIKEGKKTSKNI